MEQLKKGILNITSLGKLPLPISPKSRLYKPSPYRFFRHFPKCLILVWRNGKTKFDKIFFLSFKLIDFFVFVFLRCPSERLVCGHFDSQTLPTFTWPETQIKLVKKALEYENYRYPHCPRDS